MTCGRVCCDMQEDMRLILFAAGLSPADAVVSIAEIALVYGLVKCLTNEHQQMHFKPSALARVSTLRR